MRRLGYVTAALLLVALGAFASPARAAAPTCNGKTATKWLTSPGTLTGDPGVADVLVGSNGDDTINGGDQNDTICGRGGSDNINGEAGDDTIFGEDGNDGVTLTASALKGGPGNDKVNGGDGNDYIADADLTNGNDTYSGGYGDDLIIDGNGVNVAHGDAGADQIFVSGKAYGDAGDDPAVQAKETQSTPTHSRDAVADGGSGNDGHAPVIIGLAGVIVDGGTADGGSGNDVVAGIAAGDVLLGGSGSDFVDGSDSDVQLLDCGAAYDGFASVGDTTVRRCEEAGINPNIPS